MDWTWFYHAPLIYAIMMPFWCVYIIFTERTTYTSIGEILLYVVLKAFLCALFVWLVFGLLPGLMA